MEVAERLCLDLRFEYVRPHPVLSSSFEVIHQFCPGIFHPEITTMAPLGERRRNMLADAHHKTKFCRAQLCDRENRLYLYKGFLHSKETGE